MNKYERGTLVVVDDDVELQNIVSHFFTPKNFKVICYSSALSALEESGRLGASWDVLLTNCHFATTSALGFVKDIKANLPNLPIILLTPLEFADRAMKAIEFGAYDFIAKPIHLGQLQVAVDRALQLKSVSTDNTELRKIVKQSICKSFSLVGQSPKFVAAMDIAKRVSKSSATVLLTGESGTGKEVFAKFIHHSSLRSRGPFIAINCSSIPEHLLESELFGHAKGSFTGAAEKRIGLFEAAENGTLFLDEIGDLSLGLQAKLLRVLQEKTIKRVGENKDVEVNCRIISATHKNLSLEIEEGRFREDLYFRLNVIPIEIPPLRERAEDLLLLAETFLKKFALANQSEAKRFSKEAVDYILANRWTGNVRELENSVERATILSSGPEVSVEDFLPQRPLHEIEKKSPEDSYEENEYAFHIPCLSQLPSLEEVINKYIYFAVQRNGGAKDKAAKQIGIDRKTLYRRLHD